MAVKTIDSAGTDGGDEGMSSKVGMKVVFGAMTFGQKGAEAVRVSDLNEAADMLDILQNHGHNEIDTARVYGASEEMLGDLNYLERGLVVGTKLAPKSMVKGPGIESYAHDKDGITRGLADSLKALKNKKVDLWYLHMPDRGVPIADTLQAVNQMYKAGLFDRFGISSFASWEVAQMCELCDRHGWKKPDVYQGAYNALQRGVEAELLPCLRFYNIAFYGFSPLAGGLLTDKYHQSMTEIEEGSRYDPNRLQGMNFRRRYWNDAYFSGLEMIRKAAQENNIGTAEATLRWTVHHSGMAVDEGDAVVLGANGPAQLERNLSLLENGPLPDELVKTFDRAWEVAMHASPTYFR
ncbi:hypothetical protein BST61_g9288 [Cercospora zeina]